MTAIEDRLEKLVAPAIAGAGFDLVRVKVSGAERVTVQIMAERPDRTMSAEDCAALSRALSPILEQADPVPGAYRLEVSSPGIDRPLVRLKDYSDWRGYAAKIELDHPIESRKKFTGVLAGIEGDDVLLDIDGEEVTALIPYARIKSGKLALTDELIRESLKAAKAAKKTDGASP